jgi:dihydrofolate reductase
MKSGDVVLIAALDKHRAIGRAGAMPWHLPDDLKRFKQLTLGKPVLMGRKTALSIGRALPGRRNLVLTRGSTAPYEGQEVVSSVQSAIDLAQGEALMVIGGGEVYALALPFATHLFLTEIDTLSAGADTFFPDSDFAAWNKIASQHHAADAKHAVAFDFVDYSRKITT